MRDIRAFHSFALITTLAGSAHAGGLLLPGSGAISTSRAGAAIASTDDGEALSLNPAGLAKSTGTTITLSAAIINYSMEFTRRGTYDPVTDGAGFVGEAFPTVKNESRPPLGIGRFQPVPVIAISSDLGGAIPGLHVAAGIYAPNAYPFRDMSQVNGQEYVFNENFEAGAPPTRYDILRQEAAIVAPSIGVAYRVMDQLDVGARFSLGFANVKSETVVWGSPANVEEDPRKDAFFVLDAKDSLIPAFGLGVTYRPRPALELAAAYNSQMTVRAEGSASAVLGPNVEPQENGVPIAIRAPDDSVAKCAPGGRADALKACVAFAVPQTATVAARYKFLDGNGGLRGDIELDVGWENWGAGLANEYEVVIDGVAAEQTLKPNVVPHRGKDTYSVRIGGSYHLPAGDHEVIVRGGVGHDTRFAQEGWLRADLDGAARTMVALGGAYRMKRVEIDAGFGFIYEGTQSNKGTCNPQVDSELGCNGDGVEQAIEDRSGPDPIFPLVLPPFQKESPVALGDYKAHYLMFMLGMKTWF
jgi:long-subunit fatty acid transport protein